MKLNELIATYNADKAKLTALVEAAESNADGKLSDDQQTEYDALKASIPALHARIERIRSVNSITEVNPEQGDRVSRVARNESKEERANNKAPAFHSDKYKFSKQQLKVLNPEYAYEQTMMFLAAGASVPSTRDFAIRYCETHNLPINATITTGMGTSALSAAVPELFTPDHWEYFASFGLFSRYAKNHVITSKKLNVPKKTGEQTVYIPGEETAITNSAQTWTEYELEPFKMATLLYIPSEADEDEIVGLLDNALQESARKFAEKEDTLGFTNSGSGNKGLTYLLAQAAGAGSRVEVAGDSAMDIWNNIAEGDLTSMASMVPSRYREAGKLAWYCHDVGLFKVFNRIGLSGNGPKVDFASGPEPTFFGYPIRTTSVMFGSLTSTEEAQCYLLFGNLEASSAFCVRREFTAEPFREYTQDLNALLCTRRSAFNNHETGSASLPGPMIGLFGT